MKSKLLSHIGFQIGKHPLLSVVLGAAAIYGTAWTLTTVFLTPRCEAIWAQPRVIVYATIGLKPECARHTVPIYTPIPSDKQLETAEAELDGGPKSKGKKP